MDSEIDRKVAALVPAGRPGRGLVQGKLHFLGALPRIDGDGSAETLGDGVERPGRAGWPRPGRARPGPSCGCCRSGSSLDEVRELAGMACRLRDSRPTTSGSCSASTRRSWRRSPLDLDTEPHLLIFGDGQSGKSSVLRAYVQRGDAHPHARSRRRSCVVDYRRSLLGEVPEEYLLDYLTSATQATPALKDLDGVPREPDPRPRRHPRAAAHAVVVDRRRGVRGRRRLRPGRDPAELAGAR